MAAEPFWATLARKLGLQAGALPRDKEIPKLLMDLKDPMADRRRSAAWSLGKMKPPPKEAIEPLVEIANKDPDAGVRNSAQWALKIIRGK